MGAEHVDYYEYDRNRMVTCRCGWTGRAGDHEDYFREVLDIRCAKCDEMLLVVAYPTHERTRAAAAAGNEEAEKEMKKVIEREAFFARAEEHALHSASDLPDLEGDDLVIEWDFDDSEKPRVKDYWTVLRHEGREIWREVAFYEGINRFEQVLWILREKYGSRLAELRPTSASSDYLCGDDIQASSRIDSLNAELKSVREPLDDRLSFEVEDDADDQPDDPERDEQQLLSMIEVLGPIDCACGWRGDATEARIVGTGKTRDVCCAACRRPLFLVGIDDE